MYIIVPLALIGISIIGIAVIVLRKTPYLKKLDVENITHGGPGLSWREFFNDILPEISGQNHKIKEFKDLWLSELEKFVRRMRLFSLKIDNFSAVLIKKIRRVNRQRPIVENGTVGIESVFGDKSEPVKKEDDMGETTINLSKLKQKEQALIIKIAKDPKNAVLYEELADIYILMEQWKDAEDSLKAALDLDPESESLKKKLSSTLEKTNSQI